MNFKTLIKIWLITGLVMLFIQVIVGGVTRLTGSGLSITKWEVVTGTLPPMNAEHWNAEFDLYKDSPQYQKINQGMTLKEFKFIYFWEYIHRLWARTMGFVFLIPFLLFYFKKQLSKHLIKRLAWVIFFAALAATFGWIMVASGLVNRPWVNAYKLTIHLCIAFAVYATLLWATFEYFNPKTEEGSKPKLYNLSKWVTGILFFQIFIGGIVSGMKAGLFYPTWPDMLGHYTPQVLLNSEEWIVDNLINYDTNPFAPALIQFIHRNTAYILSILGIYFFFKIRSVDNPSRNLKLGSFLFIIVLISQLTLGIFTVINCSGKIPLGLGVFHQGFALLLLTMALYLNYLLKKNKSFN
jgi:cytochrome c oxidase assembly protein subunit 15